jgi:hypothetical protein
VFDRLTHEKSFTRGQVIAALEHNVSTATMTQLVHNLTDSRDKSRFLPIPFDVRLYLLVYHMLFGQLPHCPSCNGSTLLGTPSGWVSCRGWKNKDKDKPCTFHSKKTRESNPSQYNTFGQLAFDFFQGSRCMSKTGREFEFPNNVKPNMLKGTEWKQILLGGEENNLEELSLFL